MNRYNQLDPQDLPIFEETYKYKEKTVCIGGIWGKQNRYFGKTRKKILLQDCVVVGNHQKRGYQ